MASSLAFTGVSAFCATFAALAIVSVLDGQSSQSSLYTTSATMRLTSRPAAQMTIRGQTVASLMEVADMPQAEVQGAAFMQVKSNVGMTAYLMVPAAVSAISMVFYLLGARFARNNQVAMAATTGERGSEDVSRRSLLQTASAVATASLLGSPALAAVPSGFKLHKDPYDGYEFLFPFGWQEVSVQGQDVLYKDIIEPLETIGVSINTTERASVTELGDVQTVCFTIADKFLTSSNQFVTLLDARSEESEGITYYTMEFTANAPNYSRHALAALAVCNGKLFTCLTGCSAKRWNKMEKSLRTAMDSFTVFKVVKMSLQPAL